jgi:hypothetical protein
MNMKYYLISNSAEEKEVGCFPQTSGLFEGYNHDAPNAMDNLTSDEFPDFIPDLRFELDEDAILTDIISPSNLDFATGLLMNEKAKKIFEPAKIISHKYYQASLKVKNKLLDYYWLHLIAPPLSIINFSDSIFLEVLPGQKKVQRIIKSEKEYDSYYDSYNINPLEIFKLSLTKDFNDQRFEVFCLPQIFPGLLISDRISSLLKENITGLSYKEQNFYVS